MKRRLLKLAVFLLLLLGGAIITLAVAWAPLMTASSWGELVESTHVWSEHSGVERYGAGWPALGLQHDVERGWYDVHHGSGFWLERNPFATKPVYLPLTPIWPGFAINTTFYAAILWLLFAVPLAWRRRRRIQRGLCPKCAYPVGDSPVCTECGTAVVKQKAETA